MPQRQKQKNRESGWLEIEEKRWGKVLRFLVCISCVRGTHKLDLKDKLPFGRRQRSPVWCRQWSWSVFLTLSCYRTNMHCPDPRSPGVWSAVTYPPWVCCCLAGWQRPHPHTRVASSGGSPLNLREEVEKRCGLTLSISVEVLEQMHPCVTNQSANKVNH